MTVRWRDSLLTRTVAAVFVVNAFMLIVLTVLALLDQNAALDRQFRLRAESTASFLAAQCQLAMLVGDRQQLEQLAQAAIAAEDIVFVEFSDKQAPIRKQRAGYKPGSESVLEVTHEVTPMRSDLMDWEGRGPSRGKLGSVRLGVSLKAQRAAFVHTISSAASTVFLSLVLILIALTVRVARHMRPFHNLIASIHEIGSGNLWARAEVGRRDEIGLLATAFNEMTERLGATTVSKEYMDNIIGSMGEGLIVLDHRKRVRKLNHAAERLLDAPAEHWIGRPVDELLTGGPLVEGTGMERICRDASSNRIVVLVSSAVLCEDAGDRGGWVVVMQDLTERKRAEQELIEAKDAAEQANRARSAFLAGVTHELRSPLTSIIWSSELLEEEFVDEGLDSHVPDLQKIRRAGESLLKIVNDVLDMAKLDAGRTNVTREAFFLSQVLDEVAQMAEPLAARNGNRIMVENRTDVLEMENDSQKFRQSLLNLVSNACKFTQEGTVTIVAERESRGGADWVMVKVADTGIGIAPEIQCHLFEPFYQGDSSEGRKYGGTGLGLALSRGFCRMMGGDLSVESTLGAGSVFTMQIPAGIGFK
ncbi:MAG: HAMP domain-containing protein [Acidobacteria bacterium]|nr:HAMP domain-containing protein [Acidobacteriota bacterium]